MAVQNSEAVRNAELDARETAMGTAPTLEIRTGPPPATTASADSGSVLVTITLPSDWMAAASAGSKAKSGTWQATASATGTAGHYRIKQGATCHEQGTVSQRAADGGSGDLKLDQATAGIVAGQTVTIGTFTWSRAA
jgi:hypothetical protein